MCSLQTAKCSFSLLVGLSFLFKDWNPGTVFLWNNMSDLQYIMQTWQKSCGVQFDRKQSLLKPLIPSVSAGWLRLRSAHLSSLRQVLPGGPAALLHGGPRHRRRHLLEGEPGAVIMHETVTRSQEFESRRRINRGIKLQNKLCRPVEPAQVWYDNYISSSCPSRRCPQTPSRGCRCTTRPPWRTTKWAKRPTTGAYPAKSP